VSELGIYLHNAYETGRQIKPLCTSADVWARRKKILPESTGTCCVEHILPPSASGSFAEASVLTTQSRRTLYFLRVPDGVKISLWPERRCTNPSGTVCQYQGPTIHAKKITEKIAGTSVHTPQVHIYIARAMLYIPLAQYTSLYLQQLGKKE